MKGTEKKQPRVPLGKPQQRFLKEELLYQISFDGDSLNFVSQLKPNDPASERFLQNYLKALGPNKNFVHLDVMAEVARELYQVSGYFDWKHYEIVAKQMIESLPQIPSLHHQEYAVHILKDLLRLQHKRNPGEMMMKSTVTLRPFIGIYQKPEIPPVLKCSLGEFFSIWLCSCDDKSWFYNLELFNSIVGGLKPEIVAESSKFSAQISKESDVEEYRRSTEDDEEIFERSEGRPSSDIYLVSKSNKPHELESRTVTTTYTNLANALYDLHQNKLKYQVFDALENWVKNIFMGAETLLPTYIKEEARTRCTAALSLQTILGHLETCRSNLWVSRSILVYLQCLTYQNERLSISEDDVKKLMHFLKFYGTRMTEEEQNHYLTDDCVSRAFAVLTQIRITHNVITDEANQQIVELLVAAIPLCGDDLVRLKLMWDLSGLIMGSPRVSQQKAMAFIALRVIERLLLQENVKPKPPAFKRHWSEVCLVIASSLLYDETPVDKDLMNQASTLATKVLLRIAWEIHGIPVTERGDFPIYFNRAVNRLYLKAGCLLFDDHPALIEIYHPDLPRSMARQIHVLYSAGFEPSVIAEFIDKFPSFPPAASSYQIILTFTRRLILHQRKLTDCVSPVIADQFKLQSPDFTGNLMDLFLSLMYAGAPSPQGVLLKDLLSLEENKWVALAPTKNVWVYRRPGFIAAPKAVEPSIFDELTRLDQGYPKETIWYRGTSYAEAWELIESKGFKTFSPKPHTDIQAFGRKPALYLTKDFDEGIDYALRTRSFGPAVCFFSVDPKELGGLNTFKPEGDDLADLHLVSTTEVKLSEEPRVSRERRKELINTADSFDLVIGPGPGKQIVETAAKSEKAIKYFVDNLVGVLFLDSTPLSPFTPSA